MPLSENIALIRRGILYSLYFLNLFCCFLKSMISIISEIYL